MITDNGIIAEPTTPVAASDELMIDGEAVDVSPGRCLCGVSWRKYWTRGYSASPRDVTPSPPCARWDDRMAAAAMLVRWPFDAVPPDPLAEEWKRFTEAWPLIAARLEKAVKPTSVDRTIPGQIFDVGEVQTSKSMITTLGPAGLGQGTIREWLHRHARGDLGLDGSIADLEVGEHFAKYPELARGVVGSKLAVESGHGIVQSRWLHREGDGPGSRVHPVTIASLLTPHGNHTFIWAPERDQIGESI